MEPSCQQSSRLPGTRAAAKKAVGRVQSCLEHARDEADQKPFGSVPLAN